jgi:hypothetical protein
MTTEELIEAAARAIDPDAFADWQRMYAYCISCRDDEEIAKRYADKSSLASIEAARTKARAVISLTIEACRKEATNFLAEYHGNLSADPRRAAAQTAQEIAARIRALAPKVEG